MASRPQDPRTPRPQDLQHRHIVPFQKRQSLQNYFRLQFGVVGFAKRESQRVGDRECSRRTDLGRNPSQHRDGRCRNASFFDGLLSKTDGLRANRSHRDHERDIDLVFDQYVGNLRHGVFDESTGRGDRTHHRNVSWSDRADFARSLELLESVER